MWAKILKKTNKPGLLTLVLALFLLFALLSLGFAYYVEYMLDIKPCKLCIYQRIPYVFLALYTAICIISKKTYHYWIYISIFVISAALSGYHFAIERGFITELTPCTTQDIQPSDLTTLELKRLIYNAPVSCKEVMFKIFGFSMAEVNFAVSSAILAMLAVFKKYIYNDR